MSDWTEATNNGKLDDRSYKRIKKLYTSQISIPEEKPQKQFLLCPVGSVGSGKSTVVVPLAKKLNLVRVSHDEIRKILKENNFNYDRSKEMASEIIGGFLDQKYSVAVDANCGAEETLSRIEKLKKENNLKVIWLHINPPEEFIINKLEKHPQPTWLFRSGKEAVKGYYLYKNKYGDFKNLDLDYIYTFDTSKPDLEKQIEESYQKIIEKLRI